MWFLNEIKLFKNIFVKFRTFWNNDCRNLNILIKVAIPTFLKIRQDVIEIIIYETLKYL